MKIIKTVEIFNDMDAKVEIGDTVSIETYSGVYDGVVKSIKPNCIVITRASGTGLSIGYANILKFN